MIEGKKRLLRKQKCPTLYNQQSINTIVHSIFLDSVKTVESLQELIDICALVGNVMNTNCMPAITVEAVPSGYNIPTWLLQSICDGECDNHLFLYQTEGSRSQILHRLAQLNVPIDTTHHLTLRRFISLMILDSGLPPVLQDSSGLFLSIHAHVKKAAESGDLPHDVFTSKSEAMVAISNRTTAYIASLVK